jgi:hypothetical protein
MICGQCKTSVPKDARTCPNCGADMMAPRPRLEDGDLFGWRLSSAWRPIPNRLTAGAMTIAGAVGCAVAAIISGSSYSSAEKALGPAMAPGVLLNAALFAGLSIGIYFKSRIAAAIAVAIYAIQVAVGVGPAANFIAAGLKSADDLFVYFTLFVQLIVLPLMIVSGARGAFAWHHRRD